MVLLGLKRWAYKIFHQATAVAIKLILDTKNY